MKSHLKLQNVIDKKFTRGRHTMAGGSVVAVVSVILSFFLLAPSSLMAQSTAFAYQGSLKDGVNPANGSYDFEFLLFDSLAGGLQLGSTLTRNAVAVANGTFAVNLDFGGQFPGANRFLEIRVRQTGGGAFTPLAPRQSIGSSPYSVQSLNAANSVTATTATNATQLGGVAANQYVLTTDPRMTDARNPLPSSPNYIWNQNSVLQPSSNFVISGNGDVGGTLAASVLDISGNATVDGTLEANTVNITGNGTAGGTLRGNRLDASDGFYSSGRHVISLRGNNVLVGNYAGEDLTTGDRNVFMGEYVGENTTTGNDNSFFGYSAGASNGTGSDNAFFGGEAGRSNVAGSANAFFGKLAGVQNTSGFENSFFGSEAGYASQGGQNAFFGRRAGVANTTGDRNSFFGTRAGDTNTTGFNNTIIGYLGDVLSENLRNSTAVGHRAAVGTDHSLILGAISGINGCGDFGSFCESVNVGIGTTMPVSRLHIVGGTDAATAGGGYIVTGDVGAVNLVIDNNEIIARNNGIVSTLFLNADGGDVNLIQNGNGNVGIGIATTPQDRLHVDGIIRVQTLGSAGTTSVCRNASNQLSTCSSSLRYKTKVQPFFGGLEVIRRLRPITFDWNDSGMRDMGVGAEDVAAVEPLLVTHNSKGEIEGVKYDRVGVVLINAVNEQQAEIEVLGKQNQSLLEKVERQQIEIDELKKKTAELDELKAFVCRQNPGVQICKP